MARDNSAGAIEAFMREAISSQDRLNDGLVKLRIIGCAAVERSGSGFPDPTIRRSKRDGVCWLTDRGAGTGYG
jgi:hypothetical protein